MNVYKIGIKFILVVEGFSVILKRGSLIRKLVVLFREFWEVLCEEVLLWG